MRRKVILLCDITAFYAVFLWSVAGPWDNLLGFSVYHSRGDVWLPTPPAAANFFRDMVSTGSWLFGAFFLFTSGLIFFLGRPRGASTETKEATILDAAFYGDTRKLCVKYSVFLFISFISPFFYGFMRRFPVTRTDRIAGGFAISVGLFILMLALAELVGRLAPARRQVANI